MFCFGWLSRICCCGCCGEDKPPVTLRASGSVAPGQEPVHLSSFVNENNVPMPEPVIKKAWSSPVPVTASDLLKQRRQFWETAPTYGGNPQIWEALKMACEGDDDEVAMALLLSLKVVIPRPGEAYDSTGFRYEIPAFCVSMPENVVNEPQMVKPVENNIPSRPVAVKIRFANNMEDCVCEGLTSNQSLGELLPYISDHLKAHDSSVMFKNVLFFHTGQGPIQFDTLIGQLISEDDTTLVIQAMLR